jgi:hypothetical protein
MSPLLTSVILAIVIEVIADKPAPNSFLEMELIVGEIYLAARWSSPAWATWRGAGATAGTAGRTVGAFFAGSGEVKFEVGEFAVLVVVEGGEGFVGVSDFLLGNLTVFIGVEGTDEGRERALFGDGCFSVFRGRASFTFFAWGAVVATFGAGWAEFIVGEFAVFVCVEFFEGAGGEGDFAFGNDAVLVFVEGGDEGWWGAVACTVFLLSEEGGGEAAKEGGREEDSADVHGLVLVGFELREAE